MTHGKGSHCSTDCFFTIFFFPLCPDDCVPEEESDPMCIISSTECTSSSAEVQIKSAKKRGEDYTLVFNFLFVSFPDLTDQSVKKKKCWSFFRPLLLSLGA